MSPVRHEMLVSETASFSAGHYVIDSLARRLGIQLSSQRTVMAGAAVILIGGVNTNIVLAKTSKF
jgi:hypothetical protein